MITYKQLSLVDIFSNAKINLITININLWNFLIISPILMKLSWRLLFPIFMLLPAASQSSSLPNSKGFVITAYLLYPNYLTPDCISEIFPEIMGFLRL